MISIAPVLVPMGAGGDLRARAFAARLATDAGTGIRLVSVVEDASEAADRHNHLEGATKDTVGVPVEIVIVVSDSIGDSIVEAAGDSWALCMTTAATVLRHEHHFGSIAERVVRTLNRPVVLIGPKVDEPMGDIDRLVIPIDGSERAEKIIPAARELAMRLGAEPWVVTVVLPEQERAAQAAAGHDFGVLESAYVHRMAERIGLDAQFEVLHGADPAKAILDFAHPDGMVAMTTHGRTGLERLLTGSVASDIASSSHLPVMVLRPRLETPDP